MRRKQNFSRSSILLFTKDRWVVEQHFHGNFWVNAIWFFAFFSSVLDWIVLILVWFGRSLHSAHVSGQNCLWPLKLIMSQAIEGTWIRMGGYRQLRGEWVNCYKCDRSQMRYQYFVDFWHSNLVFASFSYGFVVLGTPQCPPHEEFIKFPTHHFSCNFKMNYI